MQQSFVAVNRWQAQEDKRSESEWHVCDIMNIYRSECDKSDKPPTLRALLAISVCWRWWMCLGAMNITFSKYY